MFVIQVCAGSGTKVSDTDLDDVIAKIEERMGDSFKENEVVHTFGSTGTLSIHGLTVPHIESSEIAEDRRIRVVLFKENLSTGWDCPRAETMMSFRRAEDATYIAQLLGRMVRTPLQCHVLVDDSLNDVRLFLPYFNQDIQAELKIVRHILEMARAIKTNAKIIALREALKSAFAHQISEGLNQKAVVFTESKRTQKYIAAELRRSGYSEEDILLFNGDFDDAMTKEIFRTWQVKNFGKTNYGRSVEYKHAIVDYFKSHAKILIVTDAGSEGLNLQFCNTIINYDLPWNPQKIEQRIGRCHRYGQTHDVVAINLLNTDNEADRRVYDILSKKFELFEGVFGASDVALGALESGVSFEKRILDIYQNCKNITAVRKAFAALNRQLDARKNAHVAELRSILLTESREAKGQALEKTKADIDKYLRDVEYWNQFEEPEVDHKLHYWKIDNWGEKIFGSHGVLFLGAFMDNTKLLFPVLLLCDENGEYINFTEDEIVSALEEANDSDVRYFKPTDEEQSYFHRIYARLISEVQDQHDKTVAPTIAYNKKKIENWVDVQQEQLHVQLTDAQKEVEEYILAEMQATDTLEKKDIRKKAAEAKKKMDKLQHDLPKRRKEIQDEAQAEIDRFNQLQEINPLLLINIVLKF